MHAPWTFFENLNEVVYLSDMDTYEIVYANKRARDLYGLAETAADAPKCYEAFQGCSRPCAICTNTKLKPGEFYEWKYYNPLVNKTFAMKDSMFVWNGRRLRLQISIDVTAQEEQARAIKDFTVNETLINEALRLALSANSPDESLEILLEFLGQSLTCERIYIFEKNSRDSYDNTYEWCSSGTTPQKDNLQNVPSEVVKFWLEAFGDGRNIIIKNVEALREKDPPVYEYLTPQNIHSLVAAPLISNKQIIGFYGVDNPPAESMNHISIICQVLGHFILSILRRRNLVRRLENLSFYDQLTGAKNRHAMNEFIESVDSAASIGILYCDVMGLKKVNDSLGHLEGDALLLRAYECLLAHFPKKSIYRIGGDEFLILDSGFSEEDFHSRTLAMKQSMPHYQVHMALGLIWQPHCSGHILQLLKEADAKMYEDKRQYYSEHEHDRRLSRKNTF